MKILILGATGGTGRLIVRDALEKGHSVVALVRSKARASELPGADIIEGDVCDEGTLTSALNGCEAVVTSLGTGVSLFREVSLLTVATRALIAAMTRNGVHRLICVSALGVGTAMATAGSCSTGCSSLCCLAMLTRTKTVRKPRSAPAHSIG